MNRPTARLCLSSLAAMLFSCTALPPPQEWTRPAREIPASVMSPPAPKPQLRELTWQEALDLARQNSPGAARARQRIQRAEARLREAKSLAYPRLDAHANYSRFLEVATFRGRTGSDVSGSNTRVRFFLERGTDVYSASLDLSYPLFDGGDAHYAREAAGARLDASKHDRESVLRELEIRVSEAFIDVLLTEGAIEIAEEALDFTREQERQARAREEAGEGLRVDRLRFSTRASEQQLALNRARANRRIQLAALGELMGLELDESVRLVPTEVELGLPDDRLVETALRDRPEIRALRARISAMESDLSRTKSSWWPELDVFASYGFLRLDALSLTNQDDEILAGAGLTWNLFEGGATLARTAAVRHELHELEDQERELALQIEREVREARIDSDVARENMGVSQEAVTLADEVLERISARYAAGEAQVIEVNDAELQRTRARLSFLESRVSFFLSQARLRRALGLKLDENRGRGRG